MFARRNIRFAGGASLALLVLCSQSPAQPKPQPDVRPASIIRTNQEAALLHAGDTAAITDLAHQMFQSVGISIEVADLFGFTDRVVQAEKAYLQGEQLPIQEADVVRAINDLANSAGTPAWTHTSVSEATKLRVRLTVLYPQLMAYQGPPDSKGGYKLFGAEMSPLQAAYLATSLVYQKIYNSDYQFTAAEQKANAKLDAAAVEQTHFERVQSIINLVRGVPPEDSLKRFEPLIANFFTDLGIRPASSGTQGGQK